VLGLAFKGETDDIRESPAIDVVEMLLAEGCHIAAYDPAAMKRAEEELPAGPRLSYVESAYAAAKGADAVLVLTDWCEFADLDLKRLSSVMRYPIVVDGRNLFDPKTMHEHGITYVSIGRPAVNPARDADLVARATTKD
jgi:UDPglucose 6-dehydrogenase